MDLLRTITAPLRSADTYRRWVHLVLGGALFVPVLVAFLVLFSLGRSDPGGSVSTTAGILAIAAAAVTAGTAVLLPGVRTQQHALTRTLVGGPLADDPVVPQPSGRARPREAVWLALHLLVGFGVSFVTMIALTEAALLALAPLAQEPVTLIGGRLWALDAPTGTARWLAPLLGGALVLLLVHLVALVGAGAARLAPVLLGPSTTDRLATAQARADRLEGRDQLASELHDSIGHALSVVALQAGAAARVLDDDPAFARRALGAIAEQARIAAAELDHVLGALREGSSSTAPQRTLHELPTLVDTARTAGAELTLDRSGSPESVPPAVSREAYRLAQEGITNALRHGVEGAPIAVELRIEDRQLHLRITNPVAPRSRRRDAGGLGLTNMRERVRVLGGDLEAGLDHDTWQLAATLPYGAIR
ncbi:sensor histidine kinase [Nitriliruptor alkaliphilus]|uniref:sensor histidine kinase n=1 Tax=Nitriliruptor alkaliphilus TaxID=427918 RepID=UPI000698CEA7|nr:histidine kinase [Nitriliruptor alkaliphilus]